MESLLTLHWIDADKETEYIHNKAAHVKVTESILIAATATPPKEPKEIDQPIADTS